MTANPARGEAALIVAGETLRLRPSFAALVLAEEELGPLFAWVRRSRLGWAWTTAADIPLGEERELWRVTVADPSGAGRTIERASSSFVYSAADQMADGTATATEFTLSINQVGAIADSSPAARRIFTL